VAAQYAYTPWGELETNVDSIGGVRVNSLRWKGLLYDKETGLYYMRARYYDPKLRRFISEDPIGLEGGINEYAFGAGDPVNNGDPSGLDCVTYTYVDEWITYKFATGDVTYPSHTTTTITCYDQTAHRGGASVGSHPQGPTGQTTGGGSATGSGRITTPGVHVGFWKIRTFFGLPLFNALT
jgi:RHS repeat-associated protein